MASSSSRRGQNKRAQGGGRTPNSEPRIQVFKEFSGVNFEHADDMDTRLSSENQSDLQMNYMFIQNNVSVASNKTLETRNDLVELFKAPSGVLFTGPVCLIGSYLHAAKSDENIGYASLYARSQSDSPITMSTNVSLLNKSGSLLHIWQSLAHYDGKLIGMTTSNEIWTGDLDPLWGMYVSGSMSNAREVPDPTTDFDGHLQGVGELSLSIYYTDDHPFRIMLAHTYVNKFGPTKISPNTVFYANKPVTEWHAGCYLRIDGTIPSGYDIEAIELYYATDNAMELLFLGRLDVASSQTTWSYNWFGYMDATNMWPIANLITPTENYTKGVHASMIKAIDGRMYFWDDSSNPQRLYIGGNPGNLFSISPGTGGGFVDVEPGTAQAVKHVCKYKTQSGNSIVTMLCSSLNSNNEQRFNLVENSISLSNEQSMKSWQAEQVAGAIGSISSDGVIVCEDGLYSVSRYGLALTTMTMEYNSQIRVNYVSDPIKPAFTDIVDHESRLSNAILLECDGIIYLAFGVSSDQAGRLDNILFCYDIDLKVWWTYTLDIDTPILNLFHVDWNGYREGIGIVTAKSIYMLPTTIKDDNNTLPDHSFTIETAQLSTQMPQQGWQYLSQLEFHFDHFIGNATIEVRMTDMFGREITVKKSVSESSNRFDYVVRMRIDQRVMSYVIRMTGAARFRMTHFLARVYTLSNKVGQVWGFDDSISHRSSGSVHPTFKGYNDVRKAIFT